MGSFRAGPALRGLKVLQSKDKVDLLITDVGLGGSMGGSTDARRALR